MSAWKLDSLHLERSGSVPADIPSIPTETIAFAQVCDARARKGLMSDEALLEEARTARLPLGAGELPSREFLAALPAGCEVEYEVARSDLSAASPLERSTCSSNGHRCILLAGAADKTRPASVRGRPEAQSRAAKRSSTTSQRAPSQSARMEARFTTTAQRALSPVMNFPNSSGLIRV